MTDLDAIIDNAVIDLPSERGPKVPERFGLWRMVSLVAVAAALVITAASVLQARAASDIPVPDQEQVALSNITVTASGTAPTAGGQVQVLGLPEAESLRLFDATGTQIQVPQHYTSIVAETSADGDLVGLAIVAPDRQTSQVAITAQSTARALLLLSPGILRPDVADAINDLTVIEEDGAFAKLVSALEADPNLSQPNDGVEQAFAEIADRLPAPRPDADQGCDSVVSPAAYSSAGTCAQPESTGVLISNEQDRWALVFSGEPAYERLCGAIGPTNTGSADVLIANDRCSGTALIVAPGPIPLSYAGDPVAVQRVRVAAAINQLYDYVGPFAELAGGSAGFVAASTSHIATNTTEIIDSVEFVLESEEEFVAAVDVTREATTALDRHTAAIAAARRLLEASNTTNLIPQRSFGDDAHLALLDFYSRAGERMISPRNDWRWEVRAIDTIDFGSDA